MVAILDLDKRDVMAALGESAQCVWEPARPFKHSWNPIPNCWCAFIKGDMVIVDLRADDGFDESSYDRACGQGAAQRAIDSLRMRIRK